MGSVFLKSLQASSSWVENQPQDEPVGLFEELFGVMVDVLLLMLDYKYRTRYLMWLRVMSTWTLRRPGR